MRTALVLEHDEFIGRRIASSMRGAGWSVLMATTPEQAFSMGRMFAVDLVIADVVMQHGSTVDAVRRLTAIRPSLDVVYMSQHSRPQLERQLPVGGRHEFMQMPFDESALLDVVSTLRPERPMLAAIA